MGVQMFKVPDILIESLVKLADDRFDRWLKARDFLSGLVLRPQEVESQIKEALIDFNENISKNEDINIFIDFLIGVHSFRAYAGLTAERAADEMIKMADLADNKINETRARKLLGIFLGLNNVSVAFKAASLMLEHDYIYIRARAIVDVRPIFGDRCDDGVIGNVLCYNFRLSLQKDSELTDLSFSMSIDDLKDMKLIVDRAIEKDSIVRKQINGILN